MLKQSLQQKLQQKLSPQQIQLMKMLQIPTMELEQRIKEEMEINPALEEGQDESKEDSEKDEFSNEETEKPETDSDNDIDLADYFDADDTPDYKLYANNTGPDQEERDTPLGAGKSFHDLLYSQLGLADLDENQILLAEYLIGNLDENGYLRRELPAIVNDLAFNLNINTDANELEEVLRAIQEFDPPGVGARDLRECLLIQIRRS
jgi:RNA polymerase sigma-54 factor